MTAGEFRNGVTFEMDGQVQQVIEFQHVKPGKGAAFVRVKMKNVVTGAVTETSFNPTAKFEEAFVERREMQYLYNEGDLYYFMDNETYEQIPISKDTLGDDFRFVKENENDVLGTFDPQNIVDHWDEIRAIIAEIPSAEELAALCEKLGAFYKPEQIGIDPALSEDMLSVSAAIRNRLTLIRMRRVLDFGE